LVLKPAGRELLEAARPVWHSEHQVVESLLCGSEANRLRAEQHALS
jgi:hypothetical protein